jgi:predicted nucleotidyltransferase component of viral defense system
MPRKQSDAALSGDGGMKQGNFAVSVRQRLLNLSKKQGEDFNLTLSRYANERLLYRLASSDYAGRFALKGASLFFVWTGQLHRPTRDIDLLGYGEASREKIRRIFLALCALEVEPDGMFFDSESIRIQEIKAAEKYPGIRVILNGYLETARIRMQVDIGFGDAVTPAVQQVQYPGLLDFPAPKLAAYPKETVIAEKFETMIARGDLNSRMKDFYDVWLMSRRFTFNGALLALAIKTTFKQRQTPFPQDAPVALTGDYSISTNAQKQWRAFVSRSVLSGAEVDFSVVITRLRSFLLPPFDAVKGNYLFECVWYPDTGWRKV